MHICSLSDFLHSVPVAQMGNYQEYLKLMPSPLRELDPDQPKRLHTFGNPFKQDKKVKKKHTHKHWTCRCRSSIQHSCSTFPTCATKGMMIDEADEFVTGPQSKKRGMSSDLSAGLSVKRRRSMSPFLRRSQTPLGSTNHVGLGKSPAGGPDQQSTFKDVPQHKGEKDLDITADQNGRISNDLIDLSTVWTQERIVTTRRSLRATEGWSLSLETFGLQRLTSQGRIHLR